MRIHLVMLSVGVMLGSTLLAGVALADQHPAEGRNVTAFAVKLTGAAEVPGPGDPDGRGLALLRVDQDEGRICYLLVARRIEPATAAHIHVGGPGVAGPVVQGLVPPTDGEARACVDNATLADAIVQDPGNYYVNIHNPPFPAGAIRGNLTQ